MLSSDSIIVLKSSIKVFSLDSLESRTKKIEQLVNKIDDKSVWTILFPIIATAAAGFIVTCIYKYIDKQNEVKKEKNQIYIHCQYIQNNLYFLLFQLAYLKYDAQAQSWYSVNAAVPEERQKALDEHYNDYQLILKVEDKIGETCSDYISSIEKFEKLHGIDLAILDLTIQFRNEILSLEPANECIQDPSLNDSASEIKELRDNFYTSLDTMTEINKKLKGALK